ncbi:hypothetical protein, partial [Yoonia sp.]|uniref:hypothetical protein n=1 Tax=Yoonia sp. TaxID=2212373 RepID=UPI0025F41EF9
LRNQWPDKIGMGGRILSESLAGSPRNTQDGPTFKKWVFFAVEASVGILAILHNTSALLT